MFQISENDVNEALELLECAEMNCDSITVGTPTVAVVKWQIQQAIKALGGEPYTEPVKIPD